MNWIKENVGAFGLLCAVPLVACMVFLSALVLAEYREYQDRNAPFHPYAYEGIEVVPQEVCVGQLVTIRVDRTISDTWKLKRQDGYLYDSYWVDKETGLIVSTDRGALDVAPSDEDTVRSPVLRNVPTTPGVWTFHNDIRVLGFVGETPREQRVEMVSPLTTRVYPPDYSRCDEFERSSLVSGNGA